MKRSMVILLPLLSLLSGHLFAQSPGGIKGQSFWLKGNIAPNKAQPLALNFNPASVLNDGKAPVQLPGNIESLPRATIFTVYQNSGTVAEAPVWEMTGGFGDMQLTTQQVLSKSKKTNLAFAKSKPVLQQPGTAEAIIHTYTSYRNSTLGTENGDDKEAAIRFGGNNAPQLAKSASPVMAEFILYEQILAEEEIAKIETYLALKYGITLQSNYCNALGKTVWDGEKDKAYCHNIAGIARDDQSTLNQKQSTSSNAPGELVIGINTIAPSNSGNTGQANNMDYLVWGHNGRSGTLNQYAATTANETMLLTKNWLMRASGSTANTIATELKIDTKALLTGYLSKENFYLVIDRSGTGDFAPDHCTYIAPNNITDDGIASFGGIYWDTDGSGKDVFTFGLKPCTQVSNELGTKAATALSPLMLYPNPVTDGHYKMAITLDKPTDVQVQVYDGYQHLVDTKKGSGQATYIFMGNINMPAGTYTVRLITPDITVNKTLVVQ
jgi:hypothetical protein